MITGDYLSTLEHMEWVDPFSCMSGYGIQCWLNVAPPCCFLSRGHSNLLLYEASRTQASADPPPALGFLLCF